jgi:flagellar motor switch protein FliN/FliY
MAEESQTQDKPTPADAADAQDAATSDDAANLDAGQMAQQALADAESAADQIGSVTEGRNVELPNFQQVLADVEASGLDLLHDVDLNVKIELGRTSMFVEDVLRLSEGSVVELDKLAGDPVDLFVRGKLFAQGEVVVVDESFGIRVTKILDPSEKAAALAGA